jgi:hypothetical protein
MAAGRKPAIAHGRKKPDDDERMIAPGIATRPGVINRRVDP